MKASLAAALICLFTWSASARQLDPPVGPITRTFKTLTEVEPRIAVNATNTPGDTNNMFIISQPGSYYLTGNISAPLFTIKSGIKITASNVTLDLMGFTLKGVASSGNGIKAIASGSTVLYGITIRNGKVDSWGGTGIDLDTYAKGAIVDGVQASDNATGGIFGCDSGIIRNCAAYRNTLVGIESGQNAMVGTARLGLTEGNGFLIQEGAIASRCSSSVNSMNGFYLSYRASVIESISGYNTENGIYAYYGCRVTKNSCSSNGNAGFGAGIYLSSADNYVESNSCSSGDIGINAVDASNLIFSNTCFANTTNYLLVANNTYGPIIDRSSVSTAAVAGNSASDTSGSTHPRANFAY